MIRRPWQRSAFQIRPQAIFRLLNDISHQEGQRECQEQEYGVLSHTADPEEAEEGVDHAEEDRVEEEGGVGTVGDLRDEEFSR